METGETNLLATEQTDKDLDTLWEKLENEHESLNQNNKASKIFNLYQKMESLSSKYNAINLGIRVLWKYYDHELADMLNDYGYKFNHSSKSKNSNQYEKDLDKISRESEAILNKISQLKNKLPKKQTSKKTNLDETILNYSAFTGSGFIDTNKITVTQYYALIKIGNEKLKTLETNKPKKNGRR